jgi:hypothetical protein
VSIQFKQARRATERANGHQYYYSQVLSCLPIARQGPRTHLSSTFALSIKDLHQAPYRVQPWFEHTRLYLCIILSTCTQHEPLHHRIEPEQGHVTPPKALAGRRVFIPPFYMLFRHIGLFVVPILSETIPSMLLWMLTPQSDPPTCKIRP